MCQNWFHRLYKFQEVDVSDLEAGELNEDEQVLDDEITEGSKIHKRYIPRKYT